MSFATKHNKGSIDWGITSIENFRYMKLEDAYKANKEDYIYPVAGLYINTKGKYDDHGVLIDTLHELCLDCPAHMTEEIRGILKDPDDISDIKSGIVGAKIYTYEADRGTCYSLKWVDIEK